MLDDGRRAGADAVLGTFIHHRDRLLAIARRVLRCPYLAEDVVQDAALKATGLERGRCIDCPLHFACQIVRNLALDRERRRLLERQHAAPEELAGTVEAPGADPQQRAEAGELVRLALAAMGELPPRTRHAFARHRLGEVPQKAIAAELGVSPTLVNFMVRDADAHCRARLQAATSGERPPRRHRPLRPAAAAGRAPAAGAPA